MDYEQAYADTAELLVRNPAYSELYAQSIEHCRERMSEHEAAQYAEGLRDRASQVQAGSSLVATIIRCGGIERIILADGKPYEGTLEQLQSDESLPADARIDYQVQSTQAGLDAVAAWRETHSIASLFNEFPQFAEGFRAVLASCEGQDGKTTEQLQDELVGAGVIRPGQEDAQQLHASYFTSKLERYGGLVWDRKRWHTTAKGAQALEGRDATAS